MTAVGPDEKILRSHLEQGAFQSGVDRGRWRLVSIDWPIVVIAVAAAERAGAPNEFVFQFDLSNYPTQAPNARPWDLDANAGLPMPKWPTGLNRVQYAFSGHKNGTCLYLPCDREALQGHDQWRTQHPDMIWSPSSDITFYLRIIHDLLHSKDYQGIRGS
jgi:hypothetical protein